MKKILSAFTATPKTHEELRFRTHLRLGALVVVGLVLFVAIKFWWITAIAIIGAAVWFAAKNSKS